MNAAHRTRFFLYILLSFTLVPGSYLLARNFPMYSRDGMVAGAEPRTFSAETQAFLGEMGYTIEKRTHIGMASAILVLEDGWLAGWADGVGGGAGTGW